MTPATRAALPTKLAWVAVFGAVAALQVVAIGGQSLTGDGAYHLIAGHQALRYGRNTVNLEHPPLVKLVIALPLMSATVPVTGSLMPDQAVAATDALYRRADLLPLATTGGRLLALACFGVPLLGACLALGDRLGRRGSGLRLAAIVGLAFGVVPHFTVLQTDIAVTLSFVLVALALLRVVERPGLGGAALLGLAWGLGLACKFSALLAAPAVLVGVLAAMPANERGRPWRRIAAMLGVTTAVALLFVHAVYLVANLDYDATVGREVITAYTSGSGSLATGDRLQWSLPLLLAVERYDPWAAQWLTGALGVVTQNAIGVYPSYAFGVVSSQGRWWYHPVVWLLKTPLVITVGMALVLAAARARAGAVGWRALLRRPVVLLAAVVVPYAAVAVASNYNIGFRHLLPLVPFLYFPVAQALTPRPAATFAVLALLTVESMALAPYWLSSTSTWWLGDRNPTRFALGLGELEYRQNFAALGRDVRRRGIRQLNVLYPAISADVITAYVPGARLLAPGDAIAPGWYAVNVTLEQYVPALLSAASAPLRDREALEAQARQWQPMIARVQQGQDHGYVAATFRLWHLPE